MQEEYFKELYARDTEVNFTMENTHNVRIPDDCEFNTETPFSKLEVANALKNLRSGATPGVDGFTAEFYKMFFLKLGDPLYEMICHSFSRGTLPQQVMAGIINLIPKPSKDSRLLKNLRPITLLCTTYKIIEKCIANRLQPILENILISEDQKGFLRKRRISINIRKIMEIMHYVDQNNIEAFILSLNFAKCFDMIATEAIIKLLQYFGFSQYLIDWTRIIYTGFHAKVQNNGVMSGQIKIGRGVHQGGCASTMYFLICAEILSLELKRNQDVKGIPVNEIINLLGQFADDMDIYLLNDKDSLNAVIATLDQFQRNTGFKVNYDKTQIYRIGSLRKTDARLVTQRMVKWANDPISVLGIWISDDPKELVALNNLPIVSKIKGILQLWWQCGLSLQGKVLVINTLIASLFTYKMYTLPAIPMRLSE